MLAAIPSVAIGFLGIVLVGPGIAQTIWNTKWFKCIEWFCFTGCNGVTYYHHY